MYEIPLTGLYASNPLGAMAAFGLLRVLSEMDRFHDSRLSWHETDDWQALLHTSSEITRASLVDSLAERQEHLDLSFLSWSDDIRVQPEVFLELLTQRSFAATSGDRADADRFVAYGSELVCDGSKNLVKPTAFHLTSGQQKFMKTLRKLADDLCRNRTAAFEEALFGPWNYRDKHHSLGWDPNTERMAALRHTAPTKEEPHSVRAAVWLAFEALSLYPTAAIETWQGARLQTTGILQQQGAWTFRWPVWQVPLALPTLKSLLASPWFSDASLDAHRLTRRGISAVFESVVYRFGQGYGILRPARMVCRTS